MGIDTGRKNRLGEIQRPETEDSFFCGSPSRSLGLSSVVPWKGRSLERLVDQGAASDIWPSLGPDLLVLRIDLGILLQWLNSHLLVKPRIIFVSEVIHLGKAGTGGPYHKGLTHRVWEQEEALERNHPSKLLVLGHERVSKRRKDFTVWPAPKGQGQNTIPSTADSEFRRAVFPWYMNVVYLSSWRVYLSNYGSLLKQLRNLWTFVNSKRVWWTQRSIYPVHSAASFNPQISLDSISLPRGQTSFLDLCKYLTGCPILLTASLLEPFFINPATSINFQGNLSMVPLLTGQTQTSWEDTFKTFYNLSPTSLVRFLFKKNYLCI